MRPNDDFAEVDEIERTSRLHIFDVTYARNLVQSHPVLFVCRDEHWCRINIKVSRPSISSEPFFSY
jgi:hypothetical protein